MSLMNVFLPLVIRSGPRFRNLRMHKFCADEINWLCGEMLGTNESWEFHISALKSIAKRYKLPVDGLQIFVCMYRESSPFVEGQYECVSDGPVDVIGTKRVLEYAKKHGEDLSHEDFSSFVCKQGRRYRWPT